MEKLKKYQILTHQKPNEDIKWIFTEEKCYGAVVTEEI
jgi:hypothetical protein